MFSKGFSWEIGPDVRAMIHVNLIQSINIAGKQLYNFNIYEDPISFEKALLVLLNKCSVRYNIY